MKEQPERKVITDLTEPEKRSLRRWCVERIVEYENSTIDMITVNAEKLYKYIVNCKSDGE